MPSRWEAPLRRAPRLISEPASADSTIPGIPSTPGIQGTAGIAGIATAVGKENDAPPPVPQAVKT